VAGPAKTGRVRLVLEEKVIIIGCVRIMTGSAAELPPRMQGVRLTAHGMALPVEKSDHMSPRFLVLMAGKAKVRGLRPRKEKVVGAVWTVTDRAVPKRIWSVHVYKLIPRIHGFAVALVTDTAVWLRNAVPAVFRFRPVARFTCSYRGGAVHIFVSDDILVAGHTGRTTLAVSVLYLAQLMAEDAVFFVVGDMEKVPFVPGWNMIKPVRKVEPIKDIKLFLFNHRTVLQSFHPDSVRPRHKGNSSAYVIAVSPVKRQVFLAVDRYPHRLNGIFRTYENNAQKGALDIRLIAGREYGKTPRSCKDLRSVNSQNHQNSTQQKKGFHCAEIPFTFHTINSFLSTHFPDATRHYYCIISPPRKSHCRELLSLYVETRAFNAFILEGCLSFLIADTSI
jgi:hypothetical protein